MKLSKVKLSKEEQEIEALIGTDALTLQKPDAVLLKQLSEAADATFRKNRRINIRLSEHDLAGIQREAVSRGLPYQSLISGLIHQFIEGDLIERRRR
jgi:predicted DNA binding CopG/RHH family protein